MSSIEKLMVTFYGVDDKQIGCGNIDMAIAVYKSAIEYQPGYLPPHYNLAKSYSKLGRNREAIEQYELCIELDPEFTKAHEALSLLVH